MQKNRLITICIICFLLGFIVGAGFYAILPGIGRAGSVDGLADANATATEWTVTELRRTVKELTDRCGELEASNNRLEEHLRSAGRICESLAGTVEASGSYTASAVEISARIRAGIKALEDWYDNFKRTGSGNDNMGYR